MKPVCIIPARKGSKRIKDKNIKLFNGIPIIQRVIDIAKDSKIFSKIVVSTDSKKIANLAVDRGAEVPFLRKKVLSDDNTQITPVLIDAIKNINSQNVDCHFCIFPTAVLTKSNDLKKAYDFFKTSKFDSLIAVSEYDHSPIKALKINKYNISRKWPSLNTKTKKTQDIEMLVHDSGSFYIFDTNIFLNKRNLITKNTTFYKLDYFRSFDIDTIQDFRFAEQIYKFTN